MNRLSDDMNGGESTLKIPTLKVHSSSVVADDDYPLLCCTRHLSWHYLSYHISDPSSPSSSYAAQLSTSASTGETSLLELTSPTSPRPLGQDISVEDDQDGFLGVVSRWDTGAGPDGGRTSEMIGSKYGRTPPPGPPRTLHFNLNISYPSCFVPASFQPC